MEIEKKFIVYDVPSDLDKYEMHQIEQGYLCSYPTVRIRKANEEYYLTYKRKEKSDKVADKIIVNEEVELELNETSYNKLREKVDNNIISKNRYIIPLGNELYAELDVFKGKLEGLVMVEVEFKDMKQAQEFRVPNWFGQDVSDDARYRNVYLSTLNSVNDL